LKDKYSNVNLTYGYITKNTRISNDLEKSHRIDALCISGNVEVERMNSYYQIKQFRKKKRSLHEATFRKGRNGVRANKNIKSIVYKENWWCLGDKVKVDERVG